MNAAPLSVGSPVLGRNAIFEECYRRDYERSTAAPTDTTTPLTTENLKVFGGRLAALCINATLFLIEIAAGLAAGSASLQADALDFLGDTGNYAISLFVIGKALRYRSWAAVAKGGTMGVLGPLGDCHGLLACPARHIAGSGDKWVLSASSRSPPTPRVSACYWAYRRGDSNMRSVWLCSRNDVLGNLAVLLAALGVFGTGTGWPDVIVAAIMAGLALQASLLVIRQAMGELRHIHPAGVPAE